MANVQSLPTLISIVGVDGSGKTTLANWLSDEIQHRGMSARIVWSRFRNYLSKPLLAITRVSGHNFYCRIDGVLFGFHDFERLYGYREIFAGAQAIDVNIAAFWRIHRVRRYTDVIICERGPWDTLADVVADTGLDGLIESRLGKIYTYFVSRNARVLLIDRSHENIIKTRPELQHDRKLMRKMDIYYTLAARHGWTVIDNNQSIEDAKQQLISALGLLQIQR